MIPVEVVLDRAGRTPYRLTPNVSSLTWSTAAVGGFSSCTFTLPGPPPFWKRELPHLSMLRVILDTFVIWEGRIEDITMSLKDETTSVQAFGLQRILDTQSILRIWSKRDWDWTQFNRDPAFDLVVGNFKPDDLTIGGVGFQGNGQTSISGANNFIQAICPDRLTLTYIGASKIKGGNANLHAAITDSTDGITFNTKLDSTTNETVDLGLIALTAGAKLVRLVQYSAAAFATTATDVVQFYNIRLLGTSITEDANYGFFGGTILRDLIGLCPGLTIGQVDSGSDFIIAQIEKSIRDSARSVVEEVASYYTREWRVWEDGRFDWKSVNADEPQWIATLDDLDSGSEITATVDGLANTLVVLYTDSSDGRAKESHGLATSQRNPFVKQGQVSDVLVSPGFQMTPGSADQLSARLALDQSYPLVQGRLVIPATKTIRRAAGSPLPAFMIRGGDNIVVSDLPKTDLFSQGRDGETLFHIISTECSLSDGTMTLEIEGQTRRTDVLLARLAAATRTLTG